MNNGLNLKLIVIFAGLGFAGIVLLLAWTFNRIWGKDKKSLWGRIWQIEKLLLTFTAMTLSVFGILQIIHFYMSVYAENQQLKALSVRGGILLMIIVSFTSMFALLGAAATIVWLKKRE
ncbi:MAG: hypothetical protein JSW47_13350 [Phycisphaerales bacterium]|nr:MAG: hypothetical protein JSW47_13350 [Phycisphaerales bacterium]